MIGTNSMEIVENTKSNLSFYLTSSLSTIDLNKLTLNLKYTYDLTNIIIDGNTLSCDIPSDFIYNNDYSYSINSEYSATITVTNKLNITVSDISLIDLTSDLTLLEEGTF